MIDRKDLKRRIKSQLRLSPLAIKLNILVVGIIFLVSAVLIVISYNAFTRNVCDPVNAEFAESMTTIRRDIELGNMSELTENYQYDFVSVITELTEEVRSEEFQHLRAAHEDNEERAVAVQSWLLRFTQPDEDYNEAEQPFGKLLMLWFQVSNQRTKHHLTDIQVTGAADGVVYILAYDNSSSVDSMLSIFGAVAGPSPEPTVSAEDGSIVPELSHSGDQWFLSVSCPLRSADGAVIAWLTARRDVTSIYEGRHSFLLTSILMTVGLSVAAITLMVFLLRRMLVNPVRMISHAARDFAAEDRVYSEEDVVDLKIRSRDEIGGLARDLQAMESRIVRYTEDQTKQTAERERILTELDLAARIQSSMLPHVFPPFPDRREFSIYASMDPAKMIGGDFYDFFFTDPDHLCLVIADVSGKGIPASLYMIITKVIIQSVAMLGFSAEEILNKTNEALTSNNDEHMFVTVWLGILEVATGKLTAVNAGHERPAVMKAGGPFAVLRDKHGVFIGALKGYTYKAYELQLEPGDKLFVYTDGVPEANNADNDMFGMTRMEASLNRVCGRDPEGILRGVREDVDAFVAGADQFDDLTMLCLQYNGPAGEQPARE